MEWLNCWGRRSYKTSESFYIWKGLAAQARASMHPCEYYLSVCHCVDKNKLYGYNWQMQFAFSYCYCKDMVWAIHTLWSTVKEKILSLRVKMPALKVLFYHCELFNLEPIKIPSFKALGFITVSYLTFCLSIQKFFPNCKNKGKMLLWRFMWWLSKDNEYEKFWYKLLKKVVQEKLSQKSCLGEWKCMTVLIRY